MALVSMSKPQRFDIPHEPGEWVELRPVRYEVSAEAQEKRDPLLMLAAGLVAWSYEAEVNEETVRDLDLQTVNWLAEEMAKINGIRQGEASATGSIGTTSTPVKASPVAATPAS